MVNIAQIEPWSAIRNNKRSKIELNTPNNDDDDEDDQWERELSKTLYAIDTIMGSNLDSADERTLEDVPIAEKIPSLLTRLMI